MRNYYLDTETCGLHGMPVLIQYAIDEGDIVLYEPWRQPVSRTLELLEEIADNCFIGFNNSFDWFQLCKLYTTWDLLPRNFIPERDINLVAHVEDEARDGPCLKPRSTFDLMLHSRKGKFQSLMSRSDIRVRKVPTVLAWPLAMELENRVELDGILFARRKDKDMPKWQVFDRKNKDGDIDQDFKDVVLKFNPAGGLKYLAEYVLKIKPDYHFSDVEVDKQYRPYELGYVPFAKGVSSADDDWMCHDETGKALGYAWPGVIQEHIDHWAENAHARTYARDDVKYTRLLYDHFGRPEVDDDDSVLSCMVAAVRWHGFTINKEGAAELLKNSQEVVATSPVNINAPLQVRSYVGECLSEEELLADLDSTKKQKLETIVEEFVCKEDGELCIKCLGDGCPRCDGKGELSAGPMPVAVRAAEILKIKSAAKEVELHSKLIKAGRFHASFRVIGTLSSRMSGGDGLNAQGIKHSKEVRRMFPLAWEDMVLCGGDFDSFEVTIADAVFGDERLRTELKSGKKLHALMAMEIYPGVTYEEVLASDGSKILDMYTRGKQAVFAMLYGGDHNTIHNKLSVSLSIAEEAFNNFQKKYKGVKRAREDNFNKFQAMRQPEGIGSAIFWKDPAQFSETFLGFRRYFTLENEICKHLFQLAGHPPKPWRDVEVKVTRRDREQTAGGAVASALYGAAFQIQAGNTRAANNHLIQSPGAQITKSVQRCIWSVQPCGGNPWRVAPMNIHDEIMCVTDPDYVDDVAAVVVEAVENYRGEVPLIGMKWCKAMENWAEKKGNDGELVHIKPPEEAAMLEALDDETEDGGGIADWDGTLDDLETDLEWLEDFTC